MKFLMRHNPSANLWDLASQGTGNDGAKNGLNARQAREQVLEDVARHLDFALSKIAGGNLQQAMVVQLQSVSTGRSHEPS